MISYQHQVPKKISKSVCLWRLPTLGTEFPCIEKSIGKLSSSFSHFLVEGATVEFLIIASKRLFEI